MEVLNAVVLEFGWSAGWLTVSALVLTGLLVLWDGARGVPGCWERRAAQKKEEHTRLMREVMRDIGR
jgi:hypothetical protein